MIRRALCGLVLVLALAGCQVRTEVAVAVDDDGSGAVTVSVGLDADALARVPGIEQELRVEDLAAAGWEVTGPDPGEDGMTWVRATKPFSSPAEAEVVLAEVAGPLLRDVDVSRSRSFALTRHELSATADLGGGLEAFGDRRLAALLDGEPLGEDVAAIEERLGLPLREAFTFRFAVQLPGGGPESWEVPLGGEPVALGASSSTLRAGSIVLAALAGLAACAAVAVLVGPRLRRRPPHRHTPSA